MSDDKIEEIGSEPTERQSEEESLPDIDDLDRLLRDNPTGLIDNPIRHIEDHKLRDFLKPLVLLCNQHREGVVSEDELYRGARLAKIEHSLDLDKHVEGREHWEKMAREALRIQRSREFWKEPKDMLVLIAVCCLASAVQGWDQVANGNLGWPDALHNVENPRAHTSSNDWLFAVVQATPWFSAAILGSYLSDPLSEFIGRRRALFVAGCCSLLGSVIGSQVKTWQQLIATRIVIGLGIGGKASIVPVMESEMLPPSKRGRVLVSWQTFTATGLFLGSIACYILRQDWRAQYMSGGLPALLLLVAVFAACESPRWLIIKEDYDKAFTTLVRLRGDRIVAAKELVSIHYQIQAERRVFLKRDFDPTMTGLNAYNSRLKRSSYWERLRNIFLYPRIRRAAIAAFIVMAAQQMSGINILAFLATQYYSSEFGVSETDDQARSYLFAIGFGLTNMIFSAVAYFLVENSIRAGEDQETQQASGSATDKEQANGVNSRQSSNSSSISGVDPHENNDKQRFRGRRFLLLTSLAAGVITLLLTSTMFNLPATVKDENNDDVPNSQRNALIISFTILFTAFYSPGAGAIPFLYCAEIFPNEGRELGMSWSTFCNFLLAGFVALGVPFGIRGSAGKMIGVFSACNAVAFVLVYFFVPSTNHAVTLEDMNYVFTTPLGVHAERRWSELWAILARYLPKKSKKAHGEKESRDGDELGATSKQDNERQLTEKTTGKENAAELSRKRGLHGRIGSYNIRVYRS